MKIKRRELKPAKDIALELFGGNETAFARFLLSHTYFISPDRIRQHIEKNHTAAWFPKCVRASRQHHAGKQRKEPSVWENRDVTVCDNTKARLAFAKFTGLVMAGDREHRIRGYHVAHIWERVYDPDYFTAGWNICLMPGFLKLFTEQQDRIPILHEVIQRAAFDIYFEKGSIGLPTPSFVSAPVLDLATILCGAAINLL
jgi:hypothetical protein